MITNGKDPTNTSTLLNPKIFTDNYKTFLYENKKFIFRNAKNMECYLGIDIEKKSKEFKLKTDELKKCYNDIKKRESKKYNQENELSVVTIIENNFTSIQNSSLTIEEKQKLSLQFFFSIFNILPNNQQQQLLTFNTRHIFNLLNSYSPSQNENTITQKYEWYYLYTNQFTNCYEISKGNIIMIYNFFLQNILYANKELQVKRKLEMIINFYPFIENCLLLYISDPSKNEICLLMVEIFVDGVIYQLLKLFTKTKKTIKPQHFALIWQLLLQVLLPYLSNCIDFLPENEGLIEKIFLCFSFLRAYYGSLRKLLKFVKDYKLKHDLSKFQQKYEAIYNSIQYYYLVPNMFEWNFFPDNIIIALTKFINSQHNYCRYLLELLSFFNIQNDDSISKRKQMLFDNPAFFNKYYKCIELELKEMNIQLSKEKIFPPIITNNKFNSFYSTFLNPLLIESDKVMFSKVIQDTLNVTDLHIIFQKYPLISMFNIYCGVLTLLSKLIFLIPNDETIQSSFRIDTLNKLNILINASVIIIIPVIEIFAFIEILLQTEITEQEIKIIIDLLSIFTKRIYPTFFLKNRINDFMNEICQYLYLQCLKTTFLQSENYACTLISILDCFIQAQKNNVGKHLLKLYCHLGINNSCDLFKQTFPFITSYIEKSNNDSIITFELLNDLLTRLNEMLKQKDQMLKDEFDLIEQWISCFFIKIFRIILITKHPQIKDSKQQLLVDIFIDLVCDIVTKSESKVDKTIKTSYTFNYEVLLIDICTLEQKIVNDIKVNLKRELSKYENFNMDYLDEKKFLEIQLKSIFKLLHSFNQAKHKNKMKFLIDAMFQNHNDNKKEVNFNLFTIEILSYMYIGKDNKIYFDNPNYYSNNNLDEPCLYGNSVNGNPPPENAIILNTNKILLNVINGLSSKKYKYQKLKFISTALRHIYLLNDNALVEYLKVIIDFTILKGLLLKEGITLIILDIFSHLTTLLKSHSSIILRTKQNYIEKEHFTFFFKNSKEPTPIKENYFNIITRYLTYAYDKFFLQQKAKPVDFDINLPYIFGSISFYLNSLLIDKYPNYLVSKNQFKIQKKGILQAYLDDYITILMEFYIDVKDVNLTLPLLYALFITKEFVVAFNYEEIINFFWLCFLIRWPKNVNSVAYKFIMKSTFKFTQEYLVANVSSKGIEQNDQIKIDYLSEYLCYYYLQYLPDNIHTENHIYNEIVDIFLTNKEYYNEYDIFIFLDFCQTILFNKEYLGQNGLDDIKKTEVISNIDNAMIFSSHIETILINNEQVSTNDNNKDNINERKLNIMIISPSSNTSLLIEDYYNYKSNNKEDKSWQEGIKHLIFDISNFTKYPNQLFTNITKLKEEHKQIITNLLSPQSFIIKIPIIFVPFSKQILSQQSIFPLNTTSSPKPLSFSKFISQLGTITQHSKDSLIITNNYNLFTIHFEIMTNQPSKQKQTELINNNYIHIIYLENQDQLFGSFNDLYEHKNSQEKTLYIYLLITDIGNEHYLIRRKYNDVSLVDKYLDEILRDNYIINLHSYSGIRYFMNSLVLLKEMNRFKSFTTNENKLKQRFEMIKEINQYYIENK